MKHFTANNATSLIEIYNTIVAGDANAFRDLFTAFLQEYFSTFCVPHHKEKLYQAMSFMLIFALFRKQYDVRMEQDAGHGRAN